jgi:peptidoglycan/xylan/chitin deacetylase (PgdA/CDA1 family)
MNKKGIPVLMYHALDDEQNPTGAKDLGEQLYIVSVDNFRKQMEYLHSNGFRTYFLEELLTRKDWPHKGIVITFDDGHESNYTLALPILQEFEFKAEFFITTGWIGTKHFLKSNQIFELHKAGMSIGSHSVTHRYLNDLTNKEIEVELNESKTTLEKILETEITSFSAPGGRLQKTNMTTLAKNTGYKTLYTSRPDVFNNRTGVFSIPRFTMKRQTSHSAFTRIINLNPTVLLKVKTKNWIFQLAKQILGNNFYEISRNAMLKRKRTF